MTTRVPVPSPIGILCGGPSAERVISLRSGQAVWQALRDLRYDAWLIDISSADCTVQLRAAGIRTAFIALHGPFGEDGTVQTLLESLGISYTGSGIMASRLAMDKAAAKLRLHAAGVPVPKGYTVRGGQGTASDGLEAVSSGQEARGAPRERASASDGLGFPLVVKPVRQGSSLGLTIVEHEAEWPAALAEAGRYDTTVLCEEYLCGPELTVGVVDDAPLPVIQVVPQRRFYDYVAKYTPGMTQYLVPAPLAREVAARVQALAIQAHRVLGCHRFSRVDLMLTPDRGPMVLEVNTVPGLTATSLLPRAAVAAGISFAGLCERLLASATQPRGDGHGSS